MAMASSEQTAGNGRTKHARGWLRLLSQVLRAWPVLAFFVAFFWFWEHAISWFGVPAYILPKPSVIVTKALPDLPRLLNDMWITGLESVIGYFIALVIAVPLGLAIAFSSILRRTIYPFCVALEMTPKIAFAPLFISWLGFGVVPKVIIVFLVCFFPIVLNAVLAFGSLSDELTGFLRVTGAGAWRSFLKIRLPAALPQCFVGFKYAAINATVGATISEFIGSDRGLGFYISIQSGNMRPDLAFAGIFLLTILGLTMFAAVTLTERLVIPWHISLRRTM
jgi:NitT/TauT family transport system permease protein